MLLRPSVHRVYQDEGQPAVSNEPALCPWRNPTTDMTVFFPGATDYRTELYTLSAHRVELLRRLGPGTRIESHSLHVYRILKRGQAVGAVMVRRFSAPHGAMEVVIGVDSDGQAVGVRVQRQREPPEIAEPITKASWLAGFVGKAADSPVRVGDDIQAVPPAASPTAIALAAAVRARLIEFAVGAKTPVKAHH
jgi:hypothetical protein